ncbi:MAG: SMP-30/gluconolactonase/LRE family protein [Paludibacteraceae bacterium]|nr:SMP-30/gluconolactonase/LRE family protein [Paludibacteraceae bacterium]
MKNKWKKSILAMAVCALVSCQAGTEQTSKNEEKMNADKELKCEVELDTIMQVGEGPIWDYKYNRLLWIDTQGSLMIYSPETKKNQVIALDRQIGTVIPYLEDTVLVGLCDGIYEMSLTTKQLKFIADPEGRAAGNRYNDGKCDAEGRLWIGTMDKDCTPKKAAFFCVEPDGNHRQILDSVTISNGVTWSPDGKTMYYQDTPTLQVSAFDFDAKSGKASNRKEVIRFTEDMGTPDGNAMDEEGMLWVANWGAACVTRWNPATGELLQKIDVPALNVAALAFGGKDMETLFITTASLWMPEDKAGKYPQAGKMFSVKPGVKGAKCNYWKFGNKK